MFQIEDTNYQFHVVVERKLCLSSIQVLKEVLVFIRVMLKACLGANYTNILEIVYLTFVYRHILYDYDVYIIILR